MSLECSQQRPKSGETEKTLTSLTSASPLAGPGSATGLKEFIFCRFHLFVCLWEMCQIAGCEILFLLLFFRISDGSLVFSPALKMFSLEPCCARFLSSRCWRGRFRGEVSLWSLTGWGRFDGSAGSRIFPTSAAGFLVSVFFPPAPGLGGVRNNVSTCPDPVNCCRMNSARRRELPGSLGLRRR